MTCDAGQGSGFEFENFTADIALISQEPVLGFSFKVGFASFRVRHFSVLGIRILERTFMTVNSFTSSACLP